MEDEIEKRMEDDEFDRFDNLTRSDAKAYGDAVDTLCGRLIPKGLR